MSDKIEKIFLWVLLFLIAILIGLSVYLGFVLENGGWEKILGG